MTDYREARRQRERAGLIDALAEGAEGMTSATTEETRAFAATMADILLKHGWCFLTPDERRFLDTVDDIAEAASKSRSG